MSHIDAMSTLNLLGDSFWIAVSYGTWGAVRTGLITWTAGHERNTLLLACFNAIFLPPIGWHLITSVDFSHAYAFTSSGLSVYWFGRAWWKLHKDGPNNGRRRRRAKAALTRLRGRLVVVPEPRPISA